MGSKRLDKSCHRGKREYPCEKMKAIVLLFSMFFAVASGHWCGLGKVMNDEGYNVVQDDIITFHDPDDSRFPSYKPKDSPESESFNFTSGVFTAPHDGIYLVTLTANLHNTDRINFAQLFIVQTTKYSKRMKDYLLVEQQRVADLRAEMDMRHHQCVCWAPYLVQGSWWYWW